VGLRTVTILVQYRDTTLEDQGGRREQLGGSVHDRNLVRDPRCSEKLFEFEVELE
jgi:hypothetical protein